MLLVMALSYDVVI